MNELASQDASATPKPTRLMRLRNALRTRDWLGIAIEIAIVTIGILIAFQIEQWADRREQAREERLFLERLYREYARGVDELNSVNRHHNKVMRDFQLAFAARGDRAQLSQYASTENLGCAAGYLRTTPFSNTAFEELISSGRISMVSNPRLRARIRDLTTEQASLKDRAAAGSEVARDQIRMLDPYYRDELMPDGSTRCFVDWPELFANPQAVTAAVRVYRMHELVGEGRFNLLRMIEDVRADVGCELGRPTCRRRSPDQ